MDEEKLYNSEDESLEDEEQGMFEHFRLNVDKGQAPMRVDKYMAIHLEDTSRHRIQLAIKNSYVLVNDKVVKANYVVRPLDVIRFVMPYQRRGLEILPEDIPLDIVYEDDYLLIVNKPAGMVVHAGPWSTPSHSTWESHRRLRLKMNAWGYLYTGLTRTRRACWLWQRMTRPR